MPALPKTSRPLVIAAVMASMFMIAIEATIVSTAMPQIASQLGGLHLYAWVFASFLLTQTAMTVVFGKLSDVYGRRPILLFGIAIFVVASILCGFATSMPVLIAFRLMQGIGAGAIQPVGITVVGDLYAAEERGRVQGWLASIWAISAVLGPLAGGFIVQHTSWAWVFWINVPVGILAALGFVAFLHEDVVRRAQSVDWLGAGLFTVVVASLMVALTQGGAGDLGSAELATLILVIGLVLFVIQERRAPAPMMAFDLWRKRAIAVANGVSLLAGVALVGLTSFVPMYVQGVLQRTPLVAGLAMTMMVVGWPIGATLAAKVLVRTGLRFLLLSGAAVMPIGALPFVMLDPASSPILAAAGSAIVGFGMGLVSTAALVIVQEIVDWSQRGSSTAANLFSRNLGSTLGAAILGSILNYGLAHQGGDAQPVTGDDLRLLLQKGAVVGAAKADAIRAALQDALHQTFWGVLGVAVAAFLAALLMPEVALRRSVREIETAATEEATF
ncbi:MDR family MFS transporter [Lichenihabitans sp. Uapishka_5]|uniref:MDR family MFS transporter n=1 Tax=Lichenihabitans sp. Uapishka_5 TaxID=3037302 RepID=UPI0029E7EC64|nr:MDR family MFS transporter [Lichenihabitans sp. Uapishka_5]MDX7950201.1 MDR family MFS transporter [Lichenihabitans sp. Uapishka_5]